MLMARINPVREQLPKEAKWSDVTNACYARGIDLTEKFAMNPTHVKPYVLWGLCAADVEVDILTGNIQVKRVDLLEDTGESMSPNVDVGQVKKTLRTT